MQLFGIGERELKMARLLWAREGIGSGEVVKLCEKELNWKKSTVSGTEWMMWMVPFAGMLTDYFVRS